MMLRIYWHIMHLPNRLNKFGAHTKYGSQFRDAPDLRFNNPFVWESLQNF